VRNLYSLVSSISHHSGRERKGMGEEIKMKKRKRIRQEREEREEHKEEERN
jgi:hypothetical protein